MSGPGHEQPPQAVLMQFITGKFVGQAIATMAELKIADHLKGGPKSATELAQASGAHAPSLYRLLRGLAMVGVLVEQEGQRFALTPVGDLLRTDAPGSVRAMALFMGQGYHHAAWAQLTHSVRTGKSAFEKAHGATLFDWAVSHPDDAAFFHNAMTSFSNMAAGAVVKAYDFTGVGKIADIGGGHGALLAAILGAAPSARGTLFDRPEVAAGAKRTFAEAGVTERVEIIGGDFFASVPAGNDVYIMKHIIHDWDDDACRKLLTSCRDAMTANGRVLVVEMVVPPLGVPSFAKMLDLEMLAMTTGGRERTEEEFRALFASAGLKLAKITPTQSPVCVIEAVRA